MHILIAASDEVEPSLDAATAGSTVRWKVPKDAAVGDQCLLSLWGLGLYARAVIVSSPVKASAERGVYVADVGHISTLGEVLPHAVIAEALPEWGWPRYPKSKTTVDGEIEDVLWDFVAEFQPERPAEIEESVSNEGGAELRLHAIRERDSDLANRKRQSVLSAGGTLKCEVCTFDFLKRYGALGEGFCEVHHLRPLSDRERSEPTALQELAILCSNCHRMAHRRGLLTIAELKSVLRDVA